MNEKINLIKSDGSQVEASIICFLENITSGKRYIYYTLNETSGEGSEGTVKIYVSKISQNNPALDTPISDDEWTSLKGYMSDSLKGNANSSIKYLPLNELTDKVSVSEKAIAMPIAYDYVNKQRGIYAENVATMASTPTKEPVAEAPVTAPTTEQLQPIEPSVQTPVTPVTPEPAPTPLVGNTPVEEPTPSPVSPEPANIETPVSKEPTPNPTLATPVPEDDTEQDSDSGATSTLTPIDLNEIEKKYEDMIKSINDLKEKELSAAKRYNATIELSAMHNEQHANYVQNEQSKEVTPTPVANEPIEPAPQATVSEPTTIEPTPVTPVTPTTDANLETNWFDMPTN